MPTGKAQLARQQQNAQRPCGQCGRAVGKWRRRWCSACALRVHLEQVQATGEKLRKQSRARPCVVCRAPVGRYGHAYCSGCRLAGWPGRLFRARQTASRQAQAARSCAACGRPFRTAWRRRFCGDRECDDLVRWARSRYATTSTFDVKLWGMLRLVCELSRSEGLITKAGTECSVCGVYRPNNMKRGMCQKHYQRWVKYGDPLLTARGLVDEFASLTAGRKPAVKEPT